VVVFGLGAGFGLVGGNKSNLRFVERIVCAGVELRLDAAS
jgi:hypothetical protein